MFVGVDVRQKLWCKPFSSNTHPLLRSPTTSFRLTYRDLVCLVTYQKDNQYEHIYSFELEAWEMWSTISTLLVVRETCRLMNRRAVFPDRAVRLRQVSLLNMGNKLCTVHNLLPIFRSETSFTTTIVFALLIGYQVVKFTGKDIQV